MLGYTNLIKKIHVISTFMPWKYICKKDFNYEQIEIEKFYKNTSLLRYLPQCFTQIWHFWIAPAWKNKTTWIHALDRDNRYCENMKTFTAHFIQKTINYLLIKVLATQWHG